MGAGLTQEALERRALRRVEPDDIPQKLYAKEGAHTTGASAGRAIGTETFKKALQEFYQIRGWDQDGVPSEAKLVELGVDVRL